MSDRIILQSNLASPSISVAQDTVGEALGFKVSDYLITVDGDELVAARTDGEAISVTRSASSPAAEKITLSNLPNEELIVLVTGSGSRLLSATFDEMPESARM